MDAQMAGEAEGVHAELEARLLATLHDVAVLVARLYPLDFGVRVPLACKQMYGDADLLSAVVNAPCSPPLLCKAIWSCRRRGAPAWVTAWTLQNEPAGPSEGPCLARIRAMAHAATSQTLQRVFHGRSAFSLAVEGCRADIIALLLPLPGVDPPRTAWGVLVRKDAPSVIHNAYSRACDIAYKFSHNKGAAHDEGMIALACARAVFHLFSPNTVSGGGNLLTWAVKAGLHEHVAAWLPRCSAEMVSACTLEGPTVFALACAQARANAPNSRSNLCDMSAECARLLAESGKVDPGQPGGSGWTQLMHAAKATIPDALAALLADPRCSAQVVAQSDSAGDGAFHAVCQDVLSHPLGAKELKIQGASSRDAAACARVLAESGYDLPDSVGRGGMTAVMCASLAVVPDALALLLSHPACPPHVVHRVDGRGRTALEHLCDTMDGTSRVEVKGWEEYRTGPFGQDAHECARLLADKGALQANAPDVRGSSPAHLVCRGGFNELLPRLLDDAAYSDRWNACNESSETPFSVACWAAKRYNDADAVAPVAEADQALSGPAACALMLAQRGLVVPDKVVYRGCNHVHSAAEAGLPDVLKVLLDDPRTTPAVVLAADDMRFTPLYSACNKDLPFDSPTRRRYETCARLLAAKGALAADSPLVKGMNPAHLVCLAGLPDLLEQIVTDPAWTAALLTARATDEWQPHHTPFTIACQWALPKHAGGLFFRGVSSAQQWRARRQIASDCIKQLMKVEGAVKPSLVGGDGGSYVLWAAKAGLPDVLQHLVDLPDFEPGLAVRRDSSGDSPLSSTVIAARHEGVDKQAREQYDQCIRMLAARGALSPASRVYNTHLAHFVCMAGLPDLLEQIVADPAWTTELLSRPDRNIDLTPFAVMCMHRRDADATDEERRDLERCAVMLIERGVVDPAFLCGGKRPTHLASAAGAGFPVAVKLLLEDPRCTVEVCTGEYGAKPHEMSSPLVSACMGVMQQDTHSPSQRAGCVACAKLIVAALASRGVSAQNVEDRDPLGWALYTVVMRVEDPTWVAPGNEEGGTSDEAEAAAGAGAGR